MSYDRAASKRPVDMTLNEDFVHWAPRLTPNLSGAVEKLLGAFVDEAEARSASCQQRIAVHIAASNAFIAKHGTLANEFSEP